MKPRHLIFLILIITSFTTKASSVDSLLQLIQTEKKDTNRVNILLNITVELRSNYPDSAKSYANQALQISKRVGFSKGKNEAIYQLSVIEYFKGNYEQALKYIKISKELLSRNKKFERELALTLIIEGNVYKNIGNYNKAIEIYDECLRISKRQKDNHLWIIVSNNKANIYRREGNHDEAIKIYEEALKLCKTEDFEADRIMVLGNIGLVYKEQKEYETALSYYEQVLAYHEKTGNKRSTAILLNNIGNIYSDQEKYNQSLKAHQESLEIRQEIGDLSGQASSFLNIGNIYLKAFRDYKRALEYSMRSLEINQKINSNEGTANAFLTIANIYQEQKNHKKAIENGEKGLLLLENNDALQLKQSAYEILSASYEAIGNYKTSITYFRKFQEVKDSIFSQTNRDAVNDLTRKYRLEQHEQELTGQQILLDKEKARRSLYLGVIIFLLVLGFLSFYTIRQKQSANSKLQQLNEEVKAQNEELLLAQNRLKVANQDLNSFTRMASHDLKEPLRMMGSFSQLLKRRNKNLDESSQEYIGYITDAAQRMTRMIDDMLSYATNNIRIENMEQLDLNQVLSTVKENLKLRIKENNAVINVADNLPSIKGQDSLIGQVFQNLIANGIKFQQPDIRPEINITAESTSTENIFKITDNGIGIAPENQTKVFQLFKRFNHEYEGSGIGLATCKKIVELHNGTIDLESEEGKGTTFILRFPV
ncbi:MAG: tetratricopeptide repeat protein [Saprospiraceae bacterium]|nr:tetratricopeptide repeat protein [Saprospiraceae bacterium]